jgi:hypothetical protein
MATWPTGTKASTANCDAGTDSPRLFRSDAKQNIDNVNAIIDMFYIDSPTDGQILKYNNSNARFELDTDATGSATAATTFVGDDSTGTAVNPGETFKIAGTQNITTAVSGDTLTITGPDLSSYVTSVAFGDLTSTPTTIAGYGITDAFDGAYGSLTGTPTIPSLGDITISNSTIASSGDTIDLDDTVRFNKNYKEDINSLTSSTAISVDAAVASVHTVTLAHSTTFTILNLPTGGTVTIIITQDTTGSRTGAFTSTKFAGGTPTLSTDANAIDVVTIFNDGTNKIANIAKAFA